jgi:CubicO group peptidase (beta-lactamase class C family)
VRDDTVFRLASMSKPIVSVAALALIDQGKLSLDDPVTKWLPDFRPRLADGREPVITVRHLITHTSGLGYKFLEAADGPYHKAEVSDGIAEPGLTAAVNLERLASVPLLFEPGTSWSYGLSIDVLGEVIARAGGRTLPELVEQLVTGPLAMTDTRFTVTDRGRLAWPTHRARRPCA